VKPGASSTSREQSGKPKGELHLPEGISIDDVQAELDRILASVTFARTERLSRLLRFVVTRTIDGQGEQLKEYLLGVEVFDRRQSYDPRIDPIVRVDAARLRSKLREYYEKEGRDDAVLIDFNKGSYVPTFQRAAPRVSELAPIRLASRPFPDWKSAVLLLLAVVLGGFIYWTMALYRLNSALERQLESSRPAARLPEFEPIWGRFFSTRAENFVVFGSPVFFSTQQHNLFLRFAGVNDPTNLLNDPKFRLLQERFGPLSEPHFDYTEMGDAIALQRLTAFFGRAGVTLTALPAHQANWEAIKDGNLIFLGAPRMNPLLQHLPIQQDFEWGPDHNIYNRHPQPGEQPIYATPSHRDALTYAVIASFPGLKPNREVLLLTAHSTPGTLSAVEQVIQVENARAIVDRLHLTSSKGRKHFQILFRIAADKNVSIKTEYVTHHISPF
jgi:hypothetical protein